MTFVYFEKKEYRKMAILNQTKPAMILLVVIVLTINGCKEEAVQPIKSLLTPQAGKTVKPPPPVAVTADAENAVKATEGTYSYLAQGRRDPFKTLISGLKEKKSSGLTPLQQRSLAELKVIGIIWGVQGYMGMIETPDGKGFLIKEGILVGPDGGFVRKITENSIIVEETYTDYYGRKRSKDTVLRLHAKEEGGG